MHPAIRLQFRLEYPRLMVNSFAIRVFYTSLLNNMAPPPPALYHQAVKFVWNFICYLPEPLYYAVNFSGGKSFGGAD
jgi:hypothetical protein